MELDYYTCNLSIFRRPETVAHLFLIMCHLLLDLLCLSSCCFYIVTLWLLFLIFCKRTLFLLYQYNQ
jgi:hypothetical protein